MSGRVKLSAIISITRSRLTSPLRAFFSARNHWFGVRELYQIGGATTAPASVGLYVAVLSNDGWGRRSADRDRSRRRVARALIERSPGGDARSLFIMVPPPERRETIDEVELVQPRSSADLRGGAGGMDSQGHQAYDQRQWLGLAAIRGGAA